jgi:hypothetical protein
MSENGPREGTRDLPRPGPDAGRRAVDDDSLAGAAYGSLSRSLRRRRQELVARLEAGESPSGIGKAYASDHPFEPAVTSDEVDTAVAGVRARLARRKEGVVGERSPRAGKRDG